MKNLITREEFILAIDDVKKATTYTEELNRFHAKYGADGYIFPPDCVSSTLRLLKVCFNDKNDWIITFCFELNFGSKWKEGLFTEKDGTDIKLKTADDLYDLLIKNE